MTATIDRPAPQRTLICLAWGITLADSVLPDIIVHLVTGSLPYLMILLRMGLMLALAALSFLWRPLRPLRNYVLVLVAFFALRIISQSIDFSSPFLQQLLGGSVFDARMQAEQTGKLVMTLAMLAALLLLGYKRCDFFLARGNLQAPIAPVRWLGFLRPVPWTAFGLQWGLYIALTLGIIMYLGMRPGAELWQRLLPMLPSILFYASLNAFSEEMFYRAPMLASLEPALGGKHALGMSAFFFGIAHYFGVPGGIPGAIASIFMGWILGKAMLETRGLFWAWWIHLLSDIVIFSFLALGLLSGG